jgi:transcriptional regulator with XRE-family HTH domain
MSDKSKYHILSRLSEWRRERRLTQEELARASGVGRTTIAALETGKRRAYYSTARKLAKVLKVKPEDLFAPAGCVVNVNSGEPYHVYIGRANPRKGLKQSIWHNPFKEGRDGTREEVIVRFERHLLEERPDLVERLPEIRGKVLACWCAPEPCHGDVLLRLAEHSA